MAKLIIVLRERKMLYKKCHRNFVRKLKEGTKIEIYSNDIFTTDRFIKSEVVKEPFIEYGYFSVGIGMIDSKNYDRVVVYHSGRINHNIKAIENAIQEIS